MKYVRLCLDKIKIIIFIMVLTLFLTIINSFVLIDGKIASCIAYVSVLLYSFIIGINEGKKTLRNGYLKGLKIGLINVFIMYIFSWLFLSFNIDLKRLIYYVAIIMVTLLGSIIGINKK